MKTGIKTDNKILEALIKYCYIFCAFLLFLVLGDSEKLRRFCRLFQNHLLKLTIMVPFNHYVKSWVYLGSNMSQNHRTTASQNVRGWMGPL